MSEVFIATEPDGSKWVSLEDYEVMNKIALENKLIVEQFQKLLGVYTNTEALAKIVELQQVSLPTLDAADFCPRCGGSKVIQANFTWADCPNCVTSKSR